MGEGKITEYAEQKKIKPLIGDMIDLYLHGEMRKQTGMYYKTLGKWMGIMVKHSI